MNTAEELSIKPRLLDLIEGLACYSAEEQQVLDISVQGLQIDSRELKQGDLFIACFGRNHDARNFIPDAIATGVVAVLAESGNGWQGLRLIKGVPVLAVDKLSARVSEIAARFYGRPSQSLAVFGITGTNGKTSCSLFIAQLLNSFGIPGGVMGTLGYGKLGELQQTELTTPDPVFTQQALADMLQAGLKSVAMEVSSVGLHQKRVAAVNFDTAVFTNLSRDHLDYHESMECYAASKRHLFTMPGLKSAVVNLDDPYALSMINALGSDVEVFTYSTRNRTATVHARSFKLNRHGFKATLVTPIGEGMISGSLLGSFNFSNVLAVVASVLSWLPGQIELDIDTLCEKISMLAPVDGRMELITEDDDIAVVVDYAHTPDGLRSALTALGEHFAGNICCVFGCGGNRDKGKRPLMGEIAAQFADRIILTDDNPRFEDGDRIVKHILSGMPDRSRVMIERNRSVAINTAIADAKAGDVVLIAGKGHEDYQEVDGDKNPFSDSRHARFAISSRRTPTGVSHDD